MVFTCRVVVVTDHNMEDYEVRRQVERLFKGYPPRTVKYAELLDVEIVEVKKEK